MIYVMSDIHGEYEKYKKMLEKINLQDTDTLYILGDVVDRGKDPICILQDMMNRKNVIPLLGNHDFVAYSMLRQLVNSHYRFNIKEIRYLMMWRADGGNSTNKQFNLLTEKEKQKVLDYIATFKLYQEVYLNDKRYILVHAGLGNFDKSKDLDAYTVEEMCFERPDYNRDFFEEENTYIVCGHTPVELIHGQSKIYYNKHNICIDCGAVFEGGKLACLCLDTMEEYYID